MMDGKTYYVGGPYVGSIHDSHVWDLSGVGKYLYFQNEKSLGDKGYNGCLSIIPPTKKAKNSLTQNHLCLELKIRKYRWKVERTIGLLKNWNIIAHEYRGNLKSHSLVFLSVVLLTNFEYC